VLRDGENVLEVLFVNGSSPLTIMLEERTPGAKERRLLARFHAAPYEFLQPTMKEIRFTAHPKPLPELELTDGDRAEIQDVVQIFYDTLATKNSKLVMNLFQPAIEDARKLYPEGAAFGRDQMQKMASLVTTPGFEMQPFDAIGHLELVPNGATVIVRRKDGLPLFTSSDITLPNGKTTNVSADTVPVKKLKGQWCVTLPFGF
jgi:hypothetical protein